MIWLLEIAVCIVSLIVLTLPTFLMPGVANQKATGVHIIAVESGERLVIVAAMNLVLGLALRYWAFSKMR